MYARGKGDFCSGYFKNYSKTPHMKENLQHPAYIPPRTRVAHTMVEFNFTASNQQVGAIEDYDSEDLFN